MTTSSAQRLVAGGVVRKDLVLALNMQVNYFDPRGTSFLGEDALKVRGDIVKFLHSLSRDTFEISYSRDVRSPQDAFYEGHTPQCIVGSGDTDMVPGLTGGDSLVFVARRPSALWKSPLINHIQKLEPTRIILVGAETNVAVLFTAADLRYLGYRVIVPEPLVVSKDNYLHNAGITTLVDTLGVEVVSCL
jgi:nicotinamidase-related amidase